MHFVSSLLAITPLILGAVYAPTSPAVVPAPSIATTAVRSAGPDTSTVNVTTEDKQVLIADFYLPKASKEAAPGVLLIHDAGGNRADLQPFAERLQKTGFAVLALDLRGHGESRGDAKPWAELDEAERNRLWAFALRDLKAGADFLREEDAVHSSNLSLLGDRAGCTLVARHAVRDENVRGIVLLEPKSKELGFDLQQDLEDLGGLPTFIATSKGAKEGADRLAASAREANGGLDFVSVSAFKGELIPPISDKRLPATVAKWMKDQAVPRKGGR